LLRILGDGKPQARLRRACFWRRPAGAATQVRSVGAAKPPLGPTFTLRCAGSSLLGLTLGLQRSLWL
jgi:hypothetical protein